MRRRSSLALLAALALVVVPAVAGPAGAAGRGQSERDRILAYWTPSRLQSAVPRDFVKADHGFVPKARPGGGGTGAITGASWINGGAILKASGKVYFSMGGGNWVCSGSVVNDNRTGASIVLTAGHCAYDETADGNPNGFATNWVFIPEYDTNPTLSNCSNTTYGCWTASALVVHQGFATAGSFNDQATVHDFAFAVVGAGGKSGSAQLDSTVGSFPIQFTGDVSGQKLYSFGYPAAGKYHGNDLTYCAGNVFTDDLNDGNTWGMVCGMTGGSSGGPWLSGFNETTGSGTLRSLNSYGYSGIKNMYGPKFNDNTADVFGAANGSNGATSNTIVP
jgi:V8-like Glu-specific endopeptidase